MDETARARAWPDNLRVCHDGRIVYHRHCDRLVHRHASGPSRSRPCIVARRNARRHRGLRTCGRMVCRIACADVCRVPRECRCRIRVDYPARGLGGGIGSSSDKHRARRQLRAGGRNGNGLDSRDRKGHSARVRREHHRCGRGRPVCRVRADPAPWSAVEHRRSQQDRGDRRHHGRGVGAGATHAKTRL